MYEPSCHRPSPPDIVNLCCCEKRFSGPNVDLSLSEFTGVYDSIQREAPEICQSDLRHDLPDESSDGALGAEQQLLQRPFYRLSDTLPMDRRWTPLTPAQGGCISVPTIAIKLMTWSEYPDESNDRVECNYLSELDSCSSSNRAALSEGSTMVGLAMSPFTAILASAS